MFSASSLLSTSCGLALLLVPAWTQLGLDAPRDWRMKSTPPLLLAASSSAWLAEGPPITSGRDRLFCLFALDFRFV